MIHITIHGKTESQVARNATTVARSLETLHTNAQNTTYPYIRTSSPLCVSTKKRVYKWYIIIKYPRTPHGETKDIATRNALLALVPLQYDISVDPITL